MIAQANKQNSNDDYLLELLKDKKRTIPISTVDEKILRKVMIQEEIEMMHFVDLLTDTFQQYMVVLINELQLLKKED